jgi:hypothetical protein
MTQYGGSLPTDTSDVSRAGHAQRPEPNCKFLKTLADEMRLDARSKGARRVERRVEAA